MSAAIMHSTSMYHECSDFLLKNQSNALNQATPNNKTANLSNNKSTIQASVMNQLNSATAAVISSNILNNNLNLNQAVVEQTNSILLQHHINALQQQQHDQKFPHNSLARTISHPQNASPQINVCSIMNSFMENLNNTAHRKLERTQSEPLPQQQVNTSRYKTELCRPFEEAGECKYGEKCQFAHGYHELRNLQRHPKYKTEYCRTFHSVGFCPYGPRCHFVHNADEARAQQQLEQQQLERQNRHIKNQYNHLTASAVATVVNQFNHALPLSPPLSMSTGSDRASPTGSLSLSPTNSMASFPFGDQISPASSVFPTAFNFGNNTPPDSPHCGMSPVNTPPPPTAILQHPQTKASSPVCDNSSNGNVVPEARMPVFKRLSSTVDAFSSLAI